MYIEEAVLSVLGRVSDLVTESWFPAWVYQLGVAFSSAIGYAAVAVIVLRECGVTWPDVVQNQFLFYLLVICLLAHCTHALLFVGVFRDFELRARTKCAAPASPPMMNYRL